MTDPDVQFAGEEERVDQSRYGEFYYRHDCGLPYERNEHWTKFFGSVADGIVRELRPRSVLDVGCAMGLLVEQLRIRGVEAWGIDVSEFAIGNVHSSVAQYCAVSSAADEALPNGFPQSFDLVTCIEVIEHLEDEAVLPALENLTTLADRLLFSSSPEDYAEATHLNVKPPDEWSARLAGLGMWRNMDLDASFLTPWAAVYDRRKPVPPELVAAYERTYALQRREIRALRGEALRRHSDDIRASVDAVTVESIEAAVVQLEQQLDFARGEAASARAEEDELRALVRRLESELVEARLEIARHEALIIRSESELADALRESAGHEALIIRSESELADALRENAELQSRTQDLCDQVEGMRAIVEHRDAMLESETWRIGAAITRPMKLIRRGRRNVVVPSEVE